MCDQKTQGNPNNLDQGGFGCSGCDIISGQTPLRKTPETPVITALQLWAIVQ